MPRCPSVRSLLASTRVQPPYAPQPTRAELLAELACVAQDPAARQYAVAQLLQREEDNHAWRYRRDALRSCILSHDLKRTPQGQSRLVACSCATCARWRIELCAMEDDKAAQEPKP